jgi:hypothetical protein
VLDLLVICIEAGLSLDQATARTAEELKYAQPELCDELSIVVLEQRAGRPRADAWKHLAERTDVDCVRNLVSMLVQAEAVWNQHRQNIANSFSDTLRTQRVQACGRGGGEDHHQADLPACVFHFSLAFPGRSWPRNDLHNGVVQNFQSMKKGGIVMGSVSTIQIVSAVLAVIILIVLIQRRRTRTKY